MLTTFYPPHNFGGDGIGIQRLARALVRRGHHVTVVHDVDAFASLHRGSMPVVEPEPTGLEVHRLRSGAGALGPLLVQQLGRPALNRSRIRSILAGGRFDVINYHNVSLIGGPGLLADGSGVKLYMAHEHWLVCPTHVLWRHNREPCTSRQCLRCVVRYRRPPQLWRWTGLLDRRLAHVDEFIAMSEFSRAKHAEFGFPRDMQVLPYFLPDPESDDAPPPGPSPHARPYFLYVGRLERIKGLDDVLPVFRTYTDADLLVAGDGTHGTVLRRLAAGAANIRFLGHVSQRALAGYYSHALALIVPSVGFETFGIVLIEAFQRRTPVVARRTGPFPEIVAQAGSGMLFGNADELRSALARLRGDATLREQMARDGHRAYVRHWTESTVVPRYLDIVRRAAERHGDARIVRALDEAA
jgi:glycosyltransferase involved in cell wall biosynthesis